MLVFNLKSNDVLVSSDPVAKSVKKTMNVNKIYRLIPSRHYFILWMGVY
jgi:hypothetical protein